LKYIFAFIFLGFQDFLFHLDFIEIKVCSRGDLAASEVVVWAAICQPGDNLTEWE